MFIPHQPYLEQNTSYRSVRPAPGSPLFGIIWEIYQVNYDEKYNVIFPDICADLMVFYTPRKAAAYVAGGDPFLTTMAKVDFLPEIKSVFGVKFCTGAMGNLCLQDVTDMGSCLISGEEALICGREMIRRLLESQSFEARCDLVRQWLEKRLSSDYEVNIITHFISDEIFAHHGQVSVRNLAEETGYSERYLRMVVHDRMGTSLKQLCQVTRFQWAYHLYQKSDGQIPFSDLAAESGYYDQSHMNNNVKKLTGALPRSIFPLYRTSA